MEKAWELAVVNMLAPDLDIARRRPIWDCFQMFWMDTDVSLMLPNAIKCAAASDYSLDELHYIYSVEVRDAVKWNFLKNPIAPEWAGYDLDWLSKKIIKIFKKQVEKGKYPKSYRHEDIWWETISAGIKAARGRES